MKLTDEEFEKEWKNAEKLVDGLIEHYKAAGWRRRVRRVYFEACVNGTMDLPNGEIMTALCNTVMFERLLNKEKPKDPS
jgi:hypothetical protein